MRDRTEVYWIRKHELGVLSAVASKKMAQAKPTEAQLRLALDQAKEAAAKAKVKVERKSA